MFHAFVAHSLWVIRNQASDLCQARNQVQIYAQDCCDLNAFVNHKRQITKPSSSTVHVP